MKSTSEDPGSLTGEPYTVDKDTPFVPEFKNLALRLKENEVGIVKTAFGYHVMMRVPPPPPDPLESQGHPRSPGRDGPGLRPARADRLEGHAGREEGQGDERAKDRTKEDADKLAQDVLAKAKAPDADFKALMKEYSEDPGSKDTGKPYDVSADAPMVGPFKKLSLRLKEGEVGMVKTRRSAGTSSSAFRRRRRTRSSRKDILARDGDGAEGQGQAHPPRLDRRARRGSARHQAHARRAREARQGHRRQARQGREDRGRDEGALGGSGLRQVRRRLRRDAPTRTSSPPFKNLSLRLKLNEVGVVKSDYGIHIIKRVE